MHDYFTGAIAHSYANFGQGSGPIQIDDVNCLGNESNLLNCTYDANNHHCGHSEDAGVTCSGKCMLLLTISPVNCMFLF